MEKYIPYQDGNEWHYLANKYIQKYGLDYSQRPLFNPNKLSRADKIRYEHVYKKNR